MAKWFKYLHESGIYIIEAESNFNDIVDHILDITSDPDNPPLRNALLDMLNTTPGMVVIKKGCKPIRYDENLHSNLF